MAKINVMFFGALSEVVGKTREVIVFDGSLNKLVDHICTAHPALKNYSFQTSHNQTLTSDIPDLKDGDEIAFLPPFTGG